MVPNYIQPNADEDGCYLREKDVVAYALALDWQLIQRDGKRVYVCADCIEGVCYE